MNTSTRSNGLRLIVWCALILAVAGCPPPSTGWVRLFGGTNSEYGADIQPASDGGYIVAGKTDSYGAVNGDMYLVKTNSNGHIAWYYTFGGFEFEHTYRVVEADDGGYVMAGTTTSFGAGETDACLVKVDSEGAAEWNHTYGGAGEDVAVGLAKCSDGGYILAGRTENSQDESYDIFLVKTDEDGVEDWSTQIDYGGYEFATGVVEIASGYALTGDRLDVLDVEKIGIGELPGFTERMFLAVTDADGGLLWLKEYGDFSAGLDLVRTADGGYILAGVSEGWSVDPLEEDNGYVVKTNDKGAVAWSFEYDSPGEVCWIESVRQTSDGGYVFAGDQGSAALLLKCDEDGVQEWSRRFGSSETRRADGSGVALSPIGGYCLVGTQYNSATEDSSVYVVKTDANGNTGLPLPVIWPF